MLIAAATIWGALALWYRLPAPDMLRYVAAGMVGLTGGAAIIAQFTASRLRALVVFIALIGGLTLWWGSITPSANGSWSSDVSRQVTGRIDGDILTLTNLRDFKWHSDTDVTEDWTTGRYDLSSVQSLDLVLSYWAGPEMAHQIFSFGFADGRYLAWSVEVRRQAGDKFSPIGDFFKSNTLVIVAAEEADVIGLRTNIRQEDVRLFRLNTPPDAIRRLLEEYVHDANALSDRPRFFNSLTSNCTTTVFKMMKAIGDTTAFDWRLIANGYLPEYAYDRGALMPGFGVAELRERGHINARAMAAGLGRGYSWAIRDGMPTPP